MLSVFIDYDQFLPFPLEFVEPQNRHREHQRSEMCARKNAPRKLLRAGFCDVFFSAARRTQEEKLGLFVVLSF